MHYIIEPASEKIRKIIILLDVAEGMPPNADKADRLHQLSKKLIEISRQFEKDADKIRLEISPQLEINATMLDISGFSDESVFSETNP